ncbi:tetratricopeptide repeat protein [Geofilum rubicundum]|uniref:TPR repeat protein n=1 Tax=Geofilum rubicundum JCM 15548 TaxID=1236989 RepID=A0A0E9LRS0_9BACT|nr:tetratricopeptide repeat protein [Geofilum rubicundum]GAO27978.1 TPR repeat protein [Geofilum rubicundum JCM 15548]
MSRNYNSMTARYNTLFNGQQSFIQGEEQLKQAHNDNFTTLLPLFPYSGADKAGAVESEMDRAIAKGLKIIQKKSITVKPKRKPGGNNATYEAFYNQREFNRYVDDAYLLIGKAHLYNHEFNDALSVFEYVLREFPAQPARFEALIWMARTRVEMGDFENARLLLEQYNGLGQAPARYYGDYMVTYADYLIRTQQYNNAIPFMLTAASEAESKWDKTRRHYLLAQLYEQSGQLDKAHESYQQVARSNPDYEMGLNANINAYLLESRLNNDFSPARKELDKMADQFKNQEFRDLIYLALAHSYLQEKDTLQALTNLQLSTGYNMGNQYLLSEAYLEMADLYFELPRYPASYAYYDSSLTLIPETDQRMEKIRFRHTGLKDLTTHYTTIEREDSLQRLAGLTEEELDAFVEAIIENERQAQLNQSVGGGRNQGMDFDPVFNRSFSNQLNQQTDNQGQWYFYNPTTVSLGKMEFERKWGRRAAQDNWRRSDKSSQADEPEMQQTAMPGQPGENLPGLEEEMAEQMTGQRPTTNLPEKEKLLTDVPRSPEQLAESQEKLANAYFNAAMIFLDYFKDPAKAIEMFDALLSAQPQHELAEQALFWSAKAYMEIDNEAGSERMKQQLLSRFPDGRYAPFLRDPNHAQTLINAGEEIQRTYQNAFSAYQNNRFNEALSHLSDMKNKTDQEELLRKALLLSAVSYGKLGNEVAFESELRQLVGQHPTSAEGKMAEQWLTMLGEGLQPAIGPASSLSDRSIATTDGSVADSLSTEPASAFDFEPDQPHSIFVIVNNRADINQLIFNLADYNFNRFLLAAYNLAARNLSSGEKLVTIGPFANSREAMDYYYGLRSNTRLLQVENIEEPMLLAGTERNLVALSTTGDFNAYRRFFSQNYLNGGGGITIDMTFENLESALEEPVMSNAFSTEDGPHWGMVVVPSGNHVGRVSGFLTSHALNNFGLTAQVRSVDLGDGNTAVIVESFNSRADAEDFISSLKDVPFWNNQLRAANWYQTFVSPQNFQRIEEEGDLEKYADFQKDLPQ